MLIIMIAIGSRFFFRMLQLSLTIKAKNEMLTRYRRFRMKNPNHFEINRMLRISETSERVCADSRFLTP